MIQTRTVIRIQFTFFEHICLTTHLEDRGMRQIHAWHTSQNNTSTLKTTPCFQSCRAPSWFCRDTIWLGASPRRTDMTSSKWIPDDSHTQLLLISLQWASTFATKQNIYAHITASIICHLFMLGFFYIPSATLRHNVWVYICCLCMCG